ncbi:hypothetical protein A2U01_0106281, partial [Trifolium medium]|nr:hypothetical protein [Trifolium medium]
MNRKDLCIEIEGNSRGFELSQGISKEELLKTLEVDQASIASVGAEERIKIKG